MEIKLYKLTLFITAIFLFGCTSSDEDVEVYSKGSKSEKVDVCHYDSETGTWKTINISENALEAHRKHGDKYDWDGDGYYPENECGIGEDAGYDCDDTNADYHEEITRFKDNDGDGFGDETTRLKSCVPDPNYDWVLNGNDCDDTDPELNVSCDDPCLDEAINQVSALIQGLGGTNLNVTITSSNTFLISWESDGRNGRGCIETTAEATGEPETGCGYINLHHENVPCS